MVAAPGHGASAGLQSIFKNVDHHEPSAPKASPRSGRPSTQNGISLSVIAGAVLAAGCSAAGRADKLRNLPRSPSLIHTFGPLVSRSGGSPLYDLLPEVARVLK